MSNIDKLIKLIEMKNIAESLDEQERQKIADDVILGYQIDEDSREEWLETNRTAMNIVRQCESNQGDGLYEGQSKVIFPLLSPAIIQLASRLTQHTVRNNKTVECAVLGKDRQIPDPEDVQQIQQALQSGQIPQGQPAPQPRMIWEKQYRSKRVTGFMNWELLIESKTWLPEDHKLNTIVAAWGTGYKQVYYDYITKKICSELIHPENVIVNQKVSCLDKAPRITVRHYMTKNDIIENINAGYFLDVDLDLLKPSTGNTGEEQAASQNDSREKQPVYELLCQTCYIDLDNDGYLEPYKCYVNTESRQLLCIIPAFELKDLNVSEETKKLISIKRRLDIVDQHLLDSPDGNYYSLGLNHLLTHTNEAITSILRQLLDAGTLSNAAAVSGFVTKAFKTKERQIKIKLGQFNVLDCNPTVDPTKQIINMPFREPSQVLLGLLQLLIESGKNNGFINDILTGDVEMQNVPATTSMAMIEQATRSFKPIIAKKYMSLKDEFTIRYHLHSRFLDDVRYAKFQDSVIAVSKQDFNEDDVDIAPVADPTLSSESQGFARASALRESLQFFGPVMDMKEAAIRYFTQLEFDAPEKLIQHEQAPPDPKMMEVQLKAQIAQKDAQIEQLHVQLEAEKIKTERGKLALKQEESARKDKESKAKILKMVADAHKDNAQALISKQQADTAERAVDVEEKKVDVMKMQAQKKDKTGE